MARKVVNSAILLALVLVSRGECRTAIVERYRYIGTAHYSRIVVDLSRPIAYSLRSVRGAGPSTPPRRLILDIPAASIGPEAREPLVVRDALVRGIRTGQYAAGVARIVLDFTREAEYRVFALQDPFRLIIDLRGAGSGPASREEPTVRLASAARILPPPKRSHASESSEASRPPKAGRAPVPRDPQQTLASLPPPPDAAAPEKSPRVLKVMIDPGHGGRDPGAKGVGGIEEKDVVLSIALDLAERLRGDENVEPFLTRSDDRTVSLEERTALANAAEADLFLSIHANASPHRTMRGIEVYYLNNTDNRGTLRLAAMENGLRWDPQDPSLAAAIPDLSYILSDLRQVYKVEESRRLAVELGEGLVRQLRSDYDGVGDYGVKEGPFYVLVGAYMPCVLVEVSYLTHPIEGARLGSLDYRRALAEGIYRGIQTYVAQSAIAKNL